MLTKHTARSMGILIAEQMIDRLTVQALIAGHVLESSAAFPEVLQLVTLAPVLALFEKIFLFTIFFC